MKTPNNGVETSQNQPQKMGAIKGLSAKIVTALAAIGIATSVEKVEGAVIVINGAPNSTVSTPLAISGPAIEAPGIVQPENSRLIMNRGPQGTLTESTSRFTVTLNPADIGVGGILTISGTATIGTGKSYSLDGNGYANTNFDINQKILWGATGSPTTTISFLDGPLKPNTGSAGFDASEVYNLSQAFSLDIPVSVGGNYNLDNVMESLNADSASGISNLSFSFAPIPETGAATLGLLGASALLLRRKRENEQEDILNK